MKPDLSNIHLLDDYERKEKIQEVNNYQFSLKMITIISLVSALILLCITLVNAEEWTDEQIVNAIYKAEGGSNAKYPYGIRSIPCGTRDKCYEICKNTVRNNRKRFAEYGYKSHEDFISFLSSRYAPIGAGNDPKNLNKNWLKNVNFFLTKDN